MGRYPFTVWLFHPLHSAGLTGAPRIYGVPDGSVGSPPGTYPPDILITASPTDAISGAPETSTVVVYGYEAVIKSVAIDFEDDGTWDENQSFNEMTVTATFLHAYANAGSFDVRARVVDGNNRLYTQLIILTVTDPPTPPTP